MLLQHHNDMLLRVHWKEDSKYSAHEDKKCHNARELISSVATHALRQAASFQYHLALSHLYTTGHDKRSLFQLVGKDG